LPFKITEQVKELNWIAVNQATPRILSEISQYIGYIERVESLPVPLEHPKNLSSAGTRLLRPVYSTF